MESTSEFNILLPYCNETNNDVFMNILKNVVARSKLDVHYLDSAFISALNGNELAIEQEDVTVNWTLLHSKEQQIRQAKLLGYWTMNVFPSLGKKIFGETYRAPKRIAVEVVGNSVMSPETVDDFIIPKMKLRLIQLNVNGSTVAKVKHFVKVPAFVGKINEQQISRKMKSSDIKPEFLETCWQALKCGEFPKNFDFAVSLF